MEKHKSSKGKPFNAGAVLAAALVCALAVAMWLIVYSYDNKYTAQGPKAFGGVLMLDNQKLADYPRIFLTDGWEFYGGRLLSPDDF